MGILGNIDTATFLKEYWQKKPLLIRNAFPDFTPPIDPDEIAGLACDEEVESRLIFEEQEGKPWQLLHGPFNDETFEKLPNENWTLLVQALDQWVPEAADLLEAFTFIPRWRLDDIMVSFAPKGGSVGPHFDYYDVFLIQGMGQRKWQVGPKSHSDSKLLKGTPLKILADMEVTEEWILNPGDMLYLPPMYAHNGVALDDCMTFSVGFRAPSESDILLDFTEHLSSQLHEQQRYTDIDPADASQQPALINDSAVDVIHSLITQHLNSKEQIKHWLASHMTQSKYPQLHEALEEPLEWQDIQALFQPESQMVKNETSRWAYFKQNGMFHLVINGQEYPISQSNDCKKLATLLANKRRTPIADLNEFLTKKDCQELLLNLINENHIYFEEAA